MSTDIDHTTSPDQKLTQSRYHRGVSGRNPGRTKDLNRRVVLESIRINGPLERADIVEQTGLAVQTVSNIVNDLIENGLIKKCQAEQGRLGSPARPLVIEPDGALSIGLSLDQRTILGCVANLAGHSLLIEEIPIEGLDSDAAFKLIFGLVEHLRLKASKKSAVPIIGLGVAVSGPFGVRSYLLDGPTSTPVWMTNAFIDELSQKTGLQIELSNDSTASAIGQRVFGIAQNISSFAHVFVGYGTAVGYFLNDRVYCGTDGNAGEIGHVMFMPGGHDCFCGNQGCLEQYLSLYSIQNRLGVDVFNDAALADLSAQMANPVGKTKQWLEDAAEVLRRAVHTIEQLADPDCVIVGGYMPSPILNAVIAKAQPLYPSIRQRGRGSGTRVLLGLTGRDVGVLSAAALPLYSQLDPALEIILKK
jgi:predicted NBD/HSP70 family sugar kinase